MVYIKMSKNNNSIAEAIDKVEVTNIYEMIRDDTPKFSTYGPVYNYDNVIEEQIDLRDVLLLNLFNTINSMNDKLINGRIKDKEAEKIRIDYLKTYINACNCFINLVKNTRANTKYDKNLVKDFADIEINSSE